jgi:ABC-type nitrate/sulfonate/bicarbonate transport system substrate-binding protein
MLLRSRIIALCATAMLIAGTLSEAAGQSSKPLTTVRVGSQALLFAHLIYVFADELGYFRDEGIEVKTVVGNEASAMLAAGMLGGQYDILMAGSDVMLASAQGADIKAIAVQSSAPVWSVVVDPSIASFAGLRGKTISTSGPDSISTAAMQLAFQKIGLERSAYKMITVGSSGGRVAAVVAKQADAALAYSPVEFLIAKQGLRNLGTLAEMLPDFVGGFTAARQSWMDKNPELTIRWLRALLRGIAYFHDPKNKEDVITRGGALLSFTPDVMRDAYTYWFEKPINGVTIAERVVPKSGSLSRYGLQAAADAFLAIGALKSRFDVNNLIDERYLEQARKGL